MASSVNFDSAADFYDATRALSDDVSRKLSNAIIAELSGAGAERLLEVGIGTGRVARPLAERGLRVTGVDISPRMLDRLRAQLGPNYPAPDLLLADATALPFASESFGGVLVVHVLHLVSSWKRAIEELRRALRPDGVLMIGGSSSVGQSPWDAGVAKWEELMAKRKQLGGTRRAKLSPHTPVGRVRPKTDQIQAGLRALGGSCRTETVAEEDDVRTPEESLDWIRRRINSWTWEIPEKLFFDCLEEYEVWAKEYFGDMDAPQVERVQHSLEVWTFDDA